MERFQSYCNSMSDIVYILTKIKFLVHAKLFSIIVFNQQK